MPRDANGNYTLPIGNPVITQTLIESNWANTTMQDLAAEMTDSLSRSGKGGLTGALPIVDSAGAIPGLSFVNEPTTGLKRFGTGDVRMQILGDDRMRWRSGVDQRPEVQINGEWKPIIVEVTGVVGMPGVSGQTVMPFYNATPPPGWTLETLDAFVRNIAIGGTPETVGGTDDPTNLSDSVNISINISGTTGSAGSHSHSFSDTSSGPSQTFGTSPGAQGTASAGHNHDVSGTTGSAGNHNHSFSDSDSDSDNVSFSPRYAMMVLGKLN